MVAVTNIIWGGIFLYNQPELILEKYGLVPRRIIKGRGVFICDTKNGEYILSPFKSSKERALFVKDVLEYINSKGLKVEVILENLEHEIITNDSYGTGYILKSYIEGNELEPDNAIKVTKAVMELGKFHNITSGYTGEMPDNIDLGKGNLPLIEKKHMNELTKVRNFIKSKNKKGDFEFKFLEYFPYYFNQAAKSVEGITDIWDENEKMILCHGDFTHHNIVEDESGEIRIINFEGISAGFPLWDLTNFMRKIMEKNDWDVALGQQLIEAYNYSRKLNEKDIKIIGYLLLFPMRYWKIANHYKNTNKDWLSVRDNEKLQGVIKQEENRSIFLRKIFNL